MARNIVYIDGQNSLYKAADFLIRINAITNKQELVKLDFRYLLESLFPQDKLIIKYFGVNTIKRQEEYGDKILNKSIIFADNLRRLKNYLEVSDVEFYGVGSLQVRNRDECENCGYVGYKMAEKGVDVGLAVEMVSDSYNSDVEKQVLLSSDIDLLPAIKSAKHNNKEFYYVAFEGRQVYAISAYAKETKFVSNKILLEAFIRALEV